MASVYDSVTEAIGDTPLIRLSRLPGEGGAPVWAKVEFLSVGGSVKDRAALSMIERAEAAGDLRPGGTVVEASSGNTGIGLAIVGRSRGYRVVVGVSDKSAQEKIDILRAYGAEVLLAPTAVAREHPDHLFNVVRRLVDDTPGAWLANQYDNLANPDAHHRTTGPEIWAQTGGRVTHLVAGIGTGGTITGTGGYLKQISDGAVTVVGADPESSAYGGGDGSAYFVESIGHFVHPDTADDAWPEAYDRTVLDRIEKVSDRDSLLATRSLARDEGLLAGPSSGTAVAAALRVARELSPDDLVVVVLPDSGRSYLSKVHSDDWLLRWGFLDGDPGDGPTVGDVLDRAAPSPDAVTVPETATVAAAVDAAGSRTALPVVLARADRPYGYSAGEIVGAVRPADLAAAVADGSVPADDPVSAHLVRRLPLLGVGRSAADACTALPGHDDVGVVVRDGRVVGLVCRAELDRALTG